MAIETLQIEKLEVVVCDMFSILKDLKESMAAIKLHIDHMATKVLPRKARK